MRTLIELTVDNLNGQREGVEEWEELEFMVESGCGATVIGPDDAKAVRASDPDPTRNYKLADGSLTQDKGEKNFVAQTSDEKWRNIKARVTDVEKPLLSVSQVVQGGPTAVFSPSGSYIDSPGGVRMPIELRSNVYYLKSVGAQ